MSIALVISSLSSGGAERVMSQLANCWAARGETVTLITLDSWCTDSYSLHPRVRRVALGLMSDTGGGWAAVRSNFARIAALRDALLTSGAPAVVSFEGRTNVLVLLACAGTRLLRIVSERINPSEHPIGLAWTLLRRMIYPSADALVVQTQTALPWAKRITLGRGRAHVIPNPVRDMQAFRSSAGSVANDTNTIVAVGRLAPQKGYDTLLHAFAQVAPAAPSWNLVILGDGEERQRLEALISTLGIAERVSLPGWHPEPGEVLRTAGLFVMTSRYEGFPNALLEAMACGTPVISTAWAGATEIITDGVDGLLVSDGYINLAATMQRAINDVELRTALGRNAVAVTERFRLSAIIEEWNALFAVPCDPVSDLKSCS